MSNLDLEIMADERLQAETVALREKVRRLEQQREALLEAARPIVEVGKASHLYLALLFSDGTLAASAKEFEMNMQVDVVAFHKLRRMVEKLEAQ